MLGFILAICVFNTLVGALAVLVGAEAIRLAKGSNANADLLMTAALRELDALRNAEMILVTRQTVSRKACNCF